MASRTTLTSSITIIPLPEPNTYTAKNLWKPRGARGVFGGQVIALALAAASETVQAPLGLHSQHCYFILPCLAELPLIFEVERMRDGRSYTTRVVRAKQADRVIFVLAASYALPPIDLGTISAETPFSFTPSKASLTSAKSASKSAMFSLAGFLTGGERGLKRNKDDEEASSSIPPFTPSWHIPFPADVVPFEESEQEDRRWEKFIQQKDEAMSDRAKKSIAEYIQERRESPVCIAVARNKACTARNTRMIWLKAKLRPDERPSDEAIKAMIAYMTDFQFIGTASRSVGLTIGSQPRLGMLATLDHTTHFYPFPADFDPNAPLLHVMEAASTDLRSGRGIVRGLVYTAKGQLVAVTQQEGVVRADMGREDRGLVEGGGVEGQSGKQGKAKAKL